MARQAARWFSSKWDVPVEAYEESMEECIKKGKDQAVPQWYIALENGKITGGIGVIENDYHDRKDLTPNICALYVEEPFRGQGLGGRLISHICGQALALGYHSIHLCTGHVGYYERYGFVHGGTGYHPWGESSLIYTRRL